jgi:hypothetical protein
MMKIPRRDMLEISRDNRGYTAGCNTPDCPLHLWRYDPYPSKREAWRYVTSWYTSHMRYCKNIGRWMDVHERNRIRNQTKAGWK